MRSYCTRRFLSAASSEAGAAGALPGCADALKVKLGAAGARGRLRALPVAAPSVAAGRAAGLSVLVACWPPSSSQETLSLDTRPANVRLTAPPVCCCGCCLVGATASAAELAPEAQLCDHWVKDVEEGGQGDDGQQLRLWQCWLSSTFA